MSEYIISMKAETVEKDENSATVRITPNMQEVVRCRDCKHYTPKGADKFDNGKTNMDYCTYIRGWMLQITPDGFCAWGERRD